MEAVDPSPPAAAGMHGAIDKLRDQVEAAARRGGAAPRRSGKHDPLARQTADELQRFKDSLGAARESSGDGQIRCAAALRVWNAEDGQAGARARPPLRAERGAGAIRGSSHDLLAGYPMAMFRPRTCWPSARPIRWPTWPRNGAEDTHSGWTQSGIEDAGCIEGELLALSQAVVILPLLDAFEGFDPGSSSNLYHRVLVAGRPGKAWLGCTWRPTGNYRAKRGHRRPHAPREEHHAERDDYSTR